MRVWPLVGLLLVSCTATLPPPAPRLDALPEVEPAPSPVVVGPVLPVEELDRLMASEPRMPSENPLNVIADANAKALVQPTRERFDRAIMRYRHTPGNLYQIHVGVDAPLTVILPAGEKFLQHGGLDKRWEVRIPEENEEATETYLLLIAPEAKLKGRWTLVTTRAAYMMEVTSHTRPGLVAVAWQLPEAPKRPYDFLSPGEYRVGYEAMIEAGTPIWAPIRPDGTAMVWDTGPRGKTLIHFPPEKRTHQSPVLYVLAPDGQKQLVNYRDRGLWYEVDRLFERGELRVGHDEKHGAEVVTIIRGQGYRAIRCPGLPECPPLATVARGTP